MKLSSIKIYILHWLMHATKETTRSSVMRYLKSSAKELKVLKEKGLIGFECNDIWITDEGKKEFKKIVEQESELINQFINTDFTFAVLQFYYNRGETLSIEFPYPRNRGWQLHGGV